MNLVEKSSETQHQKRREILVKISDQLFRNDPSLYYFSTTDLVHLIRDEVQKKRIINNEEYQIVQGLSAHDIQLILSFSSKCC